jgi:hypothetical protein
MQQFFIDYGLWLLIALLILIGVVFLLAGRKKTVDVVQAERPVEVHQQPSLRRLRLSRLCRSPRPRPRPSSLLLSWSRPLLLPRRPMRVTIC